MERLTALIQAVVTQRDALGTAMFIERTIAHHLHAGESADVFFNFNDGMGGNGVGVVEEMLRQQGATSFF